MMWLMVLLWSIAHVLTLIFLLGALQLKEYRLDRLQVFTGTAAGRWLLFGPVWVGRILLLIISLFAGRIFLFLSPIVYLFFIWLLLQRYHQRHLNRFRPTARIILVAIVTVIITVVAFFSLTDLLGVTLALLVIDVFQALTVLTAHALISPVARIKTNRIVSQARERLKENPQLIIIGVTGSYGKTSTKDMISAVLAQKYHVLATRESENTLLGVAYTILTRLEKNHEVFVVEMGAYTQGEIQDLCHLAPPSIGVLTGLGTQHLALFGSPENLTKAKFELIDALPVDGLAVLNGNQERIRSFASNYPVKKLFYGDAPADLKIKTQQHTTEGSIFEVEDQQGNLESFSLPVVGPHLVVNALGAIAVGRELGLTWEQIRNGLERLQLAGHSLTVQEGPSGSTVIDDTRNASRDGVLAALDVLDSIEKKKKIFVFQPFLELGDATKEAHQVVFEKMQSVCDTVYVTNNDYQTEIANYVQSGTEVMWLDSRKHIAGNLQQGITSETAILFSGRESRLVLDLLEEGTP